MRHGKINIVFPHSYLFSHSTSNGCPWHRITAHRANDGYGHLVVTFLTDEMAIEALVDVAGRKFSTDGAFVDIIRAFLSACHDDRYLRCSIE